MQITETSVRSNSSSFEKKFNIYCQNHSKKSVNFLSVKNDKRNLIEIEQLCPMCALQTTSVNKKLLILDELVYQDELTIITNWPLLDNPNVMMRFNSIYENIQQNILTKRTQSSISEFFKRNKTYLIQKIDQVEKILLQTLNSLNLQGLMTPYNEISKKEELKKVVNFFNFDSLAFKDLVKEMNENFNINNELMENVVNKFEQIIKQVDLTPFDQFFSQILQNLESYLKAEEQLSSSFISTQKSIFSQKDSHLNLQSQLKTLNEQLSTYVMDLPHNLQDKEKYSFIVQSNTMKDQLDSIINQYIDTPILSNKIKLAIKQKNICSKQKDLIIDGTKVRNMCGNQFAFLDVEITKDDVGRCFGLQINNLTQWIGIGIIERNALEKCNYVFKNDFSDKICYAISNNGYAWSLLKENQFKKEISFTFKIHDVISIFIDYDYIIFENKTTKQQMKMDFQFSKDKKFYPGFRLLNRSDEIEFI